MKKVVFLWLLTLCLPWTLRAQVVDDVYYVPSKHTVKKQDVKKETVVVTPVDEVVVKSNAPTSVSMSGGTATVVVRDRKGNVRDVDEYNRRYDVDDYAFSAANDTLYIDEKEYDGLDGEWIGGFDGSADDYEYATRIIRFRNPRYAISVSSPLYWDVVYGLNTWDWNVYTDGLYAYVFPTFTNRLWWDWRYNSFGWWGYPYYGWGWNSWYGPGWAWSWSSWWGPHYWHHAYWHGPGYWGGGRHWGNVYTTRHSYVARAPYNRSGLSSSRRSSLGSRSETVRRSSSSSRGTSVRSSSVTGNRRVVGTRASGTAASRAGVRSSGTVRRASGSSTSSGRTSTYTRPSRTRSTNGLSTGTTTGIRSSRTTTTYSRGASTMPSRTYNTNRNVNSSRSNTFSSPVRSSGSNRSSFSSGGGSSRSSGSMRSSGSFRSSGGGRGR